VPVSSLPRSAVPAQDQVLELFLLLLVVEPTAQARPAEVAATP